ncbi:glycoside hydrolase 97 [Kockovaella imperatae]|uniref:alpha-galactosidase n=1 Tax=Kockovaella imperatae TaxID=4999 RepID=A0A1Y1UPC9_9TREE|nr:glycoside hydrolase 97 [Kockovaella imperatae]ORX39832.1 glycoside hydrolase 97 [Kockovaella imperatae]
MRDPITVASPDGRICLKLATPGSTLCYTVSVDEHQVLLPSTISIQLKGWDTNHNVTLGSSERSSIHETYPFFGSRSTAINHANRTTVKASIDEEEFEVDIHVANDGVAIRLRIPARRGRHIRGDSSSWHVPGNTVVWYGALLPDYESPQHETTLENLPEGNLGFPLTAQLPSGHYVTLTEADVQDYGDLAVARGSDGALYGSLYADPSGWTTDEEITQPWRVTIIARDLTGLVNTTLVQNLNPGPDSSLASADWIQPGRSAWQWLASGDPVLEEQHQWVDWTSELGFEYYLVDEGWKDWPNSWENLKETVEYAKGKEVDVWIWVHSNLVTDVEERQTYFRKAVDAGVVGVKIDFPPPSNRTISNWYHETARDAASHQLMVDFHGATKPSGLERTWPNVLTREGVRGHEWHVTRYNRVLDSDHDVILPFTRYIAGHGDYTPTVFEPKELVGNTWAHELAQAIIFTSPFLCFGGSPETYLSNPALDVLKAIRPVWDETLVLPGSRPGTLVAEARRQGEEWLVGILNGAERNTVTLRLDDFLSHGRHWKSTLLREHQSRPDAFDRQDVIMSPENKLDITMGPRSGFVAWFRPQERT